MTKPLIVEIPELCECRLHPIPDGELVCRECRELIQARNSRDLDAIVIGQPVPAKYQTVRG